MYVIETDDLHKSYGDLQVLRGLSLRVRGGQVYGLLGPNGAGKSTLIHLLMGFLRPGAGRLRVLGTERLEQVRGRIGYVPERLRYHGRYSGREYLHFLGKFNDMPSRSLRDRVDAELERVGLTDAADRMLATYSKGMLQRLGIAQALVVEPDLLLIDEPTSGLDLAGQREVLDLLAEVRSHGHSIFLCTHHLNEIEYLCDRVGVLARGVLAAEADVAQLRAPGTTVTIQVEQLTPELRAHLTAIDAAVQCDERTVLIRPNTPALQARVLRALLDAPVAIVSLQPMERPLERLYQQAVRGVVDPVPPAADSPSVIIESKRVEAPARRPGEGDTLLNELLRRTDGDEG